LFVRWSPEQNHRAGGGVLSTVVQKQTNKHALIILLKKRSANCAKVKTQAGEWRREGGGVGERESGVAVVWVMCHLLPSRSLLALCFGVFMLHSPTFTRSALSALHSSFATADVRFLNSKWSHEQIVHPKKY